MVPACCYSCPFLFGFIGGYITAGTSICGLLVCWDLLFMDLMACIHAFYSLSSISIFPYALEYPAPDFVQTSLNFGCFMRCWYSSFRPVSSSRTEFAYILYSCGIQSLRWYHVDWRCLAAFAKPRVKGTDSFSIRGLLCLPDCCVVQYSRSIRWNLVDEVSIGAFVYFINSSWDISSASLSSSS